MEKLKPIIIDTRNRLRQRGIADSLNEAKIALDQANQIEAGYQKLWTRASQNNRPKPLRSPETNRAKRLSRSITPLISQIETLWQSQAEIAVENYKQYGLSKDMPPQLILAIATLLQADLYFDGKTENPDRFVLAETIINSVNNTGSISFIMFSCPEIDSSYLSGSDPECYINLKAVRNTATVNDVVLRTLFRDLQTSWIPIELNIILGEKDEEEYLFPILDTLNPDPNEISLRRDIYFRSFQQLCQKTFACPDTKVNVFRWSNLEPAQPLPYNGCPETWLTDEAERLSQLFKPGSYYDGIPTPSTQKLLEIAKLKIRLYAQQGQVLKQIFPFSIGLQNEYPAWLRTAMINLNLDTQQQTRILYVYPFKSNMSLY